MSARVFERRARLDVSRAAVLHVGRLREIAAGLRAGDQLREDDRLAVIATLEAHAARLAAFEDSRRRSREGAQ